MILLKKRKAESCQGIFFSDPELQKKANRIVFFFFYTPGVTPIFLLRIHLFPKAYFPRWVITIALIWESSSPRLSRRLLCSFNLSYCIYVTGILCLLRCFTALRSRICTAYIRFPVLCFANVKQRRSVGHCLGGGGNFQKRVAIML